MKTKTILLIVMMVAVFSRMGVANVSVRIADMPSSVLKYSPVFVTAAIKNEGLAEELIPINLQQARGIKVNVSMNHHTILPTWGSDSIGDDVKALQPGETFYFQQPIDDRTKEEGVYTIEVVLQSDGVCLRMDPVPGLRNPQPRGNEGGLQKLRCWTGQAIDSKQLVVASPSEKMDKQALEYALSGSTLISNGRQKEAVGLMSSGNGELLLANSYDDLKAKFPKSYYTFLAGYYAAIDTPQRDPRALVSEILRNFPDHPMADYIKVRYDVMLFQVGQQSPYSLSGPLGQYIQQIRKSAKEKATS